VAHVNAASPDPRAAAAPRHRSVLGLVFLTAFLDLAGFSILFPLFPKLLEHYLALEGPDSALGRLIAWLREFDGDADNADFLVVTLFGGLLGSLYSILQFLFAPIWGGISDRIGRRPTLLLTLCGTMLSYVAWFFAGSFAVLLVSRLVAGLMAGNLATASAVVADVTTPQNRSKGMGLLGAGIGLGFILGPAIGGLTANYDLSKVWVEGAAWGVNPFSAAALAALVLSAFNFLWAVLRLPETLSAENRGRSSDHRRSANPLVLFGAGAAGGRVARVNLIYFLAFLAFGAAEFTLVFLAVERFDYTPRQNAIMFVFVGLLIALVQGGAIRRLAPRYGDRRLAVAGHVLIAPSFVLVGLARTQLVLYAGLFLMALGSALIVPSLSALASRYAPPERQGLALGGFRSVGSLARAVGPLIGGILFWRLGSATPYLVGAALVIVPTCMALGLPDPEDSPAAAP
jgi:MFS family permease